MKALRVPDYLGHILKAIEPINRYTVDADEAGFLTTEMVQDAVIRNIEIIGEAAKIIWKTIQGDLPILYRQVQALTAFATTNQLDSSS